jgi:hypothetical protein
MLWQTTPLLVWPQALQRRSCTISDSINIKVDIPTRRNAHAGPQKRSVISHVNVL